MAKLSNDEVFMASDVVALVKKAKTKKIELKFGFGLAKKAEDCGLLLDLRKPSRSLGQQVKTAPAISKSCHGTMTVDGKDLLFLPTKPLKGLVKQLKKRFRNEGLVKFNPVMVDEDGNVIDEDTLPDADDFDDTAEAAPQPTATAGPVAPDTNTLKARFLDLGGRIKTSGGEQAVTLGGELRAAAELLKSGEFAVCTEKLDQIEETLNNTPGPSGADMADLEQKLKKALVAQLKIIQSLPDPDALIAQVRDINALIQTGEIAGAGQAFKVLSDEVKAAGETAETQDPLQIWRDAKDEVDEGLSKLQSALQNFDHPVLSRIAEFGLNGATNGNQTAMMTALMNFKKATGPDRADAALVVAEQVAKYQQFLDNDPVVELVENNPFSIPLSVRAKLGDALQKIADVSKAA